MINQLPNASFGICTALPLTRIGNTINISGFQNIGQGQNTGSVVLNSVQSMNGYCEGLIPGKLVLIDGNGTGNLNGISATGDPSEPTAIGYPLMVTECNNGSFVATLSGSVASAGTSVTCTAREVVPACLSTSSGDAPDGWSKSLPLQLYRLRYCDLARNSVVKAGEEYAVKLVKTSDSTDYYSSTINAKPYIGKNIVFGSYANGACRLAVHDGSGWHYSDYFTSGNYQWKEITFKVADNAKNLIIAYEISGVAGDRVLITQPMMDYGTAIGEGNYVPTRGFHAFTVHPNFNRNWVNGTINSHRIIRIEQESMGKLPSGLKAIHIGLEGKNSSIGKYFLIANNVSQALPNITMYSQVANTFIVNSGVSPVGKYAEPYPAGKTSDIFYSKVENEWFGVNLDMFACEL